MADEQDDSRESLPGDSTAPGESRPLSFWVAQAATSRPKALAPSAVTSRSWHLSRTEIFESIASSRVSIALSAAIASGHEPVLLPGVGLAAALLLRVLMEELMVVLVVVVVVVVVFSDSFSGFEPISASSSLLYRVSL